MYINTSFSERDQESNEKEFFCTTSPSSPWHRPPFDRALLRAPTPHPESQWLHLHFLLKNDLKEKELSQKIFLRVFFQ